MSKFMSFLMKGKKKDGGRSSGQPPPAELEVRQRPGGAPSRRPTGGASTKGIGQRKGSVVAGDKRRITPKDDLIRQKRILRFGELWSSVWALLMNNRDDLKSGGGSVLRYNAGTLHYVSAGLHELCGILVAESRHTRGGEAPPCYELLLKRDVIKLMCEYCNPTADPRVVSNPIYVNLLAFISDLVIFAGGSEERPLLGQHRQIVSPLLELLASLQEFVEDPPLQFASEAQMMPIRYSLLYLVYGISYQLMFFPNCLQFFLVDPPPLGSPRVRTAVPPQILLMKMCERFIGSDDSISASIFFAHTEDQRRNPHYDLFSPSSSAGDALGSSTRSLGASLSMVASTPLASSTMGRPSTPPSPSGRRSPTSDTHLHDKVEGKSLFLSDLAVEVVGCLACVLDSASEEHFAAFGSSIADRMICELMRLREAVRDSSRGRAAFTQHTLVTLYDRVGTVVRQIDAMSDSSSSTAFSSALLRGVASRLLGNELPFELPEGPASPMSPGSAPFLSVVDEAEVNFAGFFLSVLRPERRLLREGLIWASQKAIQQALVSTATRNRDGHCRGAFSLLGIILRKSSEANLGDSVDRSAFLLGNAKTALHDYASHLAGPAPPTSPEETFFEAETPRPAITTECLQARDTPLSFSLVYLNALSRGAAVQKHLETSGESEMLRPHPPPASPTSAGATPPGGAPSRGSVGPAPLPFPGFAGGGGSSSGSSGISSPCTPLGSGLSALPPAQRQAICSMLRRAPVFGTSGGAVRVYEELGILLDLPRIAARHGPTPVGGMVAAAPLSDSFVDDLFAPGPVGQASAGAAHADPSVLDPYVVPEGTQKGSNRGEEFDRFLVEILKGALGFAEPGLPRGAAERAEFFLLYTRALVSPEFCSTVYTAMLCLGDLPSQPEASDVVAAMRRGESKRNRVLHSNVIQNVDHLFHPGVMWTLDCLESVREASRADAMAAVSTRNGCSFLVGEELIFACSALIREAGEVGLDTLVSCMAVLSQAILFSPILTYKLMSPESLLLTSLASVKCDVSKALHGMSQVEVRDCLRNIRVRLGLLPAPPRKPSSASLQSLRGNADKEHRFEAWVVLEEWRVEVNALLEALADAEVIEQMGLRGDENLTRRRAGAMAPRQFS